MYNFKLSYNVNGAKRRRSKKVSVAGYYDLADAWKEALRCGIAHTEDDEILNSICFLGKDEDDEE